MLAVGILFDLLPLFLIIGTSVFVFKLLGDASAKAASNVAACFNPATLTDLWNCAMFASSPVTELSKIALASGAAAFTAVTLGPIMYAIGSFTSTLLALFVFLVWFLVKRVNPFSPTAKRMLTNLLTMIVESIPLLNILPGITFAVSRHIRISRMEDEERHREKPVGRSAA